MWKTRLVTIVLICAFSTMTGLRASTSRTVAQQTAINKPPAASQTPSDQDQAAAQVEEPPPAKKKFTPAKSLNEALYLSTREDRNSSAYLDQAKKMIEQKADPKAADAQKRTPLHWAVIGAMYADKKLASSYLDIAELLIGGGGRG